MTKSSQIPSSIKVKTNPSNACPIASFRDLFFAENSPSRGLRKFPQAIARKNIGWRKFYESQSFPSNGLRNSTLLLSFPSMALRKLPFAFAFPSKGYKYQAQSYFIPYNSFL